MTEYVLEIVNDLLRGTPPYDCAGSAEKLYIKIDKNGNVDIKSQNISICSGHPNEYYQIRDVLVINDNIPIPDHIINMLKQLLPSNGCQYTQLYRSHYYNVIECIKILKAELHELAHNPSPEIYNETKFKMIMTKNKILEKEFSEMEERNTHLETNCDTALKDNRKIKQENIELQEKIKKLDNELRELRRTIAPKPTILFGGGSSRREQKQEPRQMTCDATLKDNAKIKRENAELREKMTKLDEELRITIAPKPTILFGGGSSRREQKQEPRQNLRDCWSNPGGATVFTQSNAQNRMVYNPDTGIYAPEENN